MGVGLMRSVTKVLRWAQSTPPKRKPATLRQVNKLLDAGSCRSLYALRKVDFSHFSRSQQVAIAEKLVKRATRWLKSLGWRIPNTQEGLELRFFVDSFLNLADDSGALGRFSLLYATNIYLTRNSPERDLKRAIRVLKSDLQRVKSRLWYVKPVYAPKMDKLINVLKIVEKHPQHGEGWSWLTASESYINSVLHRCK